MLTSAAHTIYFIISLNWSPRPLHDDPKRDPFPTKKNHHIPTYLLIPSLARHLTFCILPSARVCVYHLH
jgi:hypothetical protein